MNCVAHQSPGSWRAPARSISPISASRLLDIPKAYGGPDVSYATLAKVIAIIAAADPSIAQITQNHLAINGHIDLDGTPEQKRAFFAWSLAGLRFGNAFSELNSKTVTAFETKIAYDGDEAIINGEKFYTTGALLAHFVPIVAVDPEGRGLLAFTDRDAPGLTVTNNWSSFGQRTTASGGVKIENVRVPRRRLLAVAAFDRPTIAGPVSQIIQPAIDAGIAPSAIDDTIVFVCTQSRPWIDSGKETRGRRRVHDLCDRRPEDQAARRRGAARRGRARDRRSPNTNSSEANVAAATIKTARVKCANDRDRDPRDQQAVRTRRHALDARRAQPRPPLAQRAHPHAARSGALEISSTSATTTSTASIRPGTPGIEAD